MSIIKHATFNETTDSHVAWFDATVARTTSDTHEGPGALSWTALASFSGVNLSNFPYFPGIVAGAQYDIDMWVKGASGSFDTSIFWNIIFNNEVGSTMGSTMLIVPVTSEWAKTETATLTAPAGATRVSWEINSNSSGVGSIILLDDIMVKDHVVEPESFLSVLDEDGVTRLPAHVAGVVGSSGELLPATARLHS